MRNLLFALSIAFITGCAGTYQSKLEFNPTEPIRVVVLPFIQVDSKDKIIDGEPPESPDRMISVKVAADV